MTTATRPAPAETVFASLPTVAEGWATPKAVAEVTELGYSTVTRHLRTLEEAGRAECSTDQAVTGVKGKAWRQRAETPRVLGPIETVELPAADVEPDPVQRYVDAAERGVFDEIRDVEDVPAEVARAAQDRDAEAPEASTERVETGADGCGCPVTVEMTLVAGELHSEVDGTERTEHRDGCWNAPTEPAPDPITAEDYAQHFPERDDQGELLPADVEPDADPEITDADRDAAIMMIAKAIDSGVIDPNSRACEKCGEDIPRDEAIAGYTRCGKCDPDGDHSVHGPAAEMSDDEANEEFDGLPTSMIDDEDGDPSPVSPAPTGGDVAAIADWMTQQRTTDPLSAQDARALTDRIRLQVTELLPLIKEAYTRRADLALGYDSWAAYCDKELRGLRMPLAERQAATAELAAEGLSTRAIAGAIGSSEATVRRDLAATGAADDAPERVTGLDGRSYPARKTAAGGTERPSADGAEDLPKSVEAPAGAGDGNDVAGPGNPLVDLRGVPFVWIAAARKGIEYHRPADNDLTACRRSMRTGTQLARDVAESAHDAKPCQRCWQDASPGDTPGQLVPGEADAPQPVDAYQRDPAARLAAVAELAPDYVQPVPEAAIEGEVLPAVGNDPDDPGPVPDPPLDPRIAEAITNNLGGLALAIGNLAVLIRDAGPHAGSNLHTLRHWRHELDLCIQLAERA